MELNMAKSKMNLPNKLTIFRILMVPVFLVLFVVPFPHFTETAMRITTAAVFAVTSLTDMVDGKIARKYNLITDFGKFMDPLADKLLVSAALICLTELGFIPAWMTIVIISREFIISGFRLIAAEKGVVIAAGWLGKWKTAVTMIMLAMMLLAVNGIGFPATGVYDVYMLITEVLLWIAVVLTVISLVDYLVKNKDVMKDEV